MHNSYICFQIKKKKKKKSPGVGSDSFRQNEFNLADLFQVVMIVRI